MKKQIAALCLALSMSFVLAVPADAIGETGRAEQVNTISCGDRHTGLVDAGGILWMWGGNDFSQLGVDGGNGNSGMPIQTIPAAVMDGVAAVSCGIQHTAVVREDGSLWTWGGNIYGQLGNGFGRTAEPVTTPVKVLDGAVNVSCGSYFTAALKSDGSLWTWGHNKYGQLGVGENPISPFMDSIRTDPNKVMDNAAAVSCGTFHTAAIQNDGSLWVWGENSCGQVGDGSTFDAYDPVKIMDDAAAVSCGFRHTAALKTDGSLWMWGDNSYGQLGLGTTEHSSVPVKVLDGVAAVSCGVSYTAAILLDGSLWMWGDNQYGQLGDGTTEHSSVPVQVLDQVERVSCGTLHTIAVRTDGTVWAWGGGYCGAFGSGGGNGLSAEDAPLPGIPIQTVPVPLTFQPAGVAWASTQNILVDGVLVEFQAYALLDESGNPTNYVKLRDVASVLNGTAAQFQVDWNGAVNIVTGAPYTPNGSELFTPFSGNRIYSLPTSATNINGSAASLDAIVLTDNSGGAYTYYKLRDLGAALGFQVDWSQETGAFIQTDRP